MVTFMNWDQSLWHQCESYCSSAWPFSSVFSQVRERYDMNVRVYILCLSTGRPKSGWLPEDRMCHPHSSHQELFQGAVVQDVLDCLLFPFGSDMYKCSLHPVVCFVSPLNCELKMTPTVTSFEEVQKQYNIWKHKVEPGTRCFPKFPVQRKKDLFCCLYPWTLDFVLSKSIFTHSSLLCIVLSVSCPQSTSCSIGVVLLCMIGLSAMSPPWGRLLSLGLKAPLFVV